MNPKIVVPEGVEIKFEGNFVASESFIDEDEEENDESTETPEDEEDDEFQDEESEA